MHPLMTGLLLDTIVMSLTKNVCGIDSLKKRCLKYAGKSFELPLMEFFTLTRVTLGGKYRFSQPKLKRSINPLSVCGSGEDSS